VVVALFLRTTRCIISTTAYFKYFIPSLSVARMAQTFHNLQDTSYDRFTQKLSSEPIFSRCIISTTAYFKYFTLSVCRTYGADIQQLTVYHPWSVRTEAVF
jgi:hypothetical protein